MAAIGDNSASQILKPADRSKTALRLSKKAELETEAFEQRGNVAEIEKEIPARR